MVQNIMEIISSNCGDTITVSNIVHDDQSLSCYICKKSFESEKDVIGHLKLIHNACASPNCSNLSDFNMHSLVCKYRGFVCSVCHAKFPDNMQLMMHFNQHINAACHICELCRSGFQQWSELQAHFREFHNQELLIPANSDPHSNVYQKCSACCKYYQLFSEYEEHISSCSPSYQCNICMMKFSNLPSLEEHKYMDHELALPVKGYQALIDGKRYFCGICYIGFFVVSILKDHLKLHVEKMNFVCDVCQNSFINDNDLQTHYLEHVEEHYEMHNVIQLHSCTSCNQTFKTRTELKNHLQQECQVEQSNCDKMHCENSDNKLETCSKTENSSTELNLKSTDISLVQEDTNGMQSCQEECPDDQEKEMARNESYVVMVSCELSDVIIYSLKDGDELKNCDDSSCVVVIDHKSLYVFQRGTCCCEKRIPVIENAVPFNMSDPIDTSLLPNHLLNVLNITDLSVSSNIENLSSQVSMSIENNFLSTTESMCENEEVAYIKAVSDYDTNAEGSDMYESESTISANPEDCESYDVADDSVFDTVEMTVNTSLPAEGKLPAINTVPVKSDNPLLSLVNIVSPVSELHVCNICKQVFGSKTSLCLHVKGCHTGFDCYRCGESFSTEEELRVHEKIDHQSAFHCDICNSSFPKEYLLKKHKRSVHGGKLYTCDVCNKEYVLKNEYEVHIMLHKGETPPTKCEDCGKVYSSVSNYMRHKAVHEGKKCLKNYVCTICDKSFIAQFPLKRHLITHMRKTAFSYECPKCKMYFSPKLFTKHVQSHETGCG